ncbi:MAG: rhomboid family intramembrane serine protease [Pseudomonadota bacterium]
MASPSENQPVFNSPAIVVTLLGLLVAVHALFTMLPDRTADLWIWRLAFVPARYGPDGYFIPGGILSQFGTPLSHMLVHGDWLHLAFNCAWLLAFGTIVARRMNAARFVALSTVSGIGGAFVFWLANPDAQVAMVGASGAVSGLMGGVFRFLFNAPRYGGFAVMREMPRAVPLMTLGEALQSRGVLVAVGVWLGLNLLFATDFASLITDGEIAWEAHVGGFLVGFLTIGIFDEAWPRPTTSA